MKYHTAIKMNKTLQNKVNESHKHKFEKCQILRNVQRMSLLLEQAKLSYLL